METVASQKSTTHRYDYPLYLAITALYFALVVAVFLFSITFLYRAVNTPFASEIKNVDGFGARVNFSDLNTVVKKIPVAPIN